MEPIATAIERLITAGLPADALMMIDPNCRPQVITDQQAYRARLSRILRRTDVVKVRVEDMAYLFPATPVRAAAAALLGQGAVLVLVTDGPRAARAYLRGQELVVDVPAVHVIDTIGAGDALGGAFLAWWSANKLTRSDLTRSDPVRGGLKAAVGSRR
jgi:fructokinase